jgi:hypothetical protein
MLPELETEPLQRPAPDKQRQQDNYFRLIVFLIATHWALQAVNVILRAVGAFALAKLVLFFGDRLEAAAKPSKIAVWRPSRSFKTYSQWKVSNRACS